MHILSIYNMHTRIIREIEMLSITLFYYSIKHLFIAVPDLFCVIAAENREGLNEICENYTTNKLCYLTNYFDNDFFANDHFIKELSCRIHM